MDLKNKLNFKLFINELKKKYDFKGLWHFTDFQNLKTIFENDYLASRDFCIKNEIKFCDGANKQIINKASTFIHSCTRFYYRAKSPTLYDNEGIKSIDNSKEIHVPIPVYLLFSEELIYKNDTHFSDGNATNSPIGNTFEFFKEMDWENIFHDTWFSPEERDYIINKRQAELLSENPVQLQKYLKKVIFRTNADLKRAIKLWGNQPKFSVDESIFSNKNNLDKGDWRYNNYILDYHINFSNKFLEIEIILKKKLDNYSILYLIKDNKGISKNKMIKNNLKLIFKDENENIVNDIKEAVKIKVHFNYQFNKGDQINFLL